MRVYVLTYKIKICYTETAEIFSARETERRNIMKIRITAMIFAVAILAALLTGCSCEHEWAEATCLTPKTCNLCQETEGEALGHSWAEATCAAPKTCNACGETEGEALPHTWMEANYQNPKTCSECGTTEGEPLLADFEKYGFACTPLGNIPQLSSKKFSYITSCSEDTTKKTIGDLYFTKYRVFEGDSTHPAKEGYEWKELQFKIYFYDNNANNYGMSVCFNFDDYYDVKVWNSSRQDIGEDTSCYLVEFNGVEYTVMIEAGNSLSSFSEWNNGQIVYTSKCYFQVPVGYDGIVLSCVDGKYMDIIEDWYICDDADENTLFFRLD